MPRSLARGPRWATLCAVWLLLAPVTKTTPESAHEFSRLGTVESLVQRGTYQLDDSGFITTLDKVFRNGHFYSHQPPLLSTLEAPIYAALHLPGLAFNNRTRELTVFLFVWLTNGLALALTIVVFISLLGLAQVPAPDRYVYGAVLPLGTWLLPYAVVANNHGIAGLLLAVLIYLLLSVEWRGTTPAKCLGLGAVLGLLTAIEILPVVSFLPFVGLYLLIRRDMTSATWRAFAAGVAAPLLAHAAINIPITGDVIPAGFHHELFEYAGSAFTEPELTGSLKYGSLQQTIPYAWQALFAGKGYFTFAPVLLLGIIVGVTGWRWWQRARGVQLVLLAGVVTSLAAALLTTNNLGGGAVGFRHATYLAPAMLTLLLPVLAGRRPAARAAAAAVAVLAGASAIGLLLFAVREPWMGLTLPPGPIGPWRDYFPIVAKLAAGTLFNQ
ncbi:MAG: hypothetical protein ABI665_27340 [Vicinamibacterales bacterium]